MSVSKILQTTILMYGYVPNGVICTYFNFTSNNYTKLQYIMLVLQYIIIILVVYQLGRKYRMRMLRFSNLLSSARTYSSFSYYSLIFLHIPCCLMHSWYAALCTVAQLCFLELSFMVTQLYAQLRSLLSRTFFNVT